MTEWFERYWWAILGVCALVAFVARRMHADRVEGSFIRRFIYALFPVLNPTSAEHKQLTPRTLWLVIIGLIVVLLVNLLARG